MTEIMQGRKIANRKLLELQEEIEKEKLSLSLGVVQVGENPVSTIYVNKKKKELEKIGISVSVYKKEENIKEEDLKKEISSLNESGIIVQLPLPSNFNKQDVLDSIPFLKDVDLLSSTSCGVFYSGKEEILPPVVGAVDILIEEYNISCRGKNVVLIGAGSLVGKPLSVFFMRKGATVSVVNKNTVNPEMFIKSADIVVSGAGSPGVVKGDMIKEGAVIIDAGTSADEGEIKGDVDANEDSMKEKASLISPVPNGVGPLTLYVLAKNLKTLSLRDHDC